MPLNPSAGIGGNRVFLVNRRIETRFQIPGKRLPAAVFSNLAKKSARRDAVFAPGDVGGGISV